MATPALRETAYAEVNWGRWIARCPNPHCHNAMALEPGQTTFHCQGPGSCWSRAQILWPPQHMADGIAELLMIRRDETTRNWLPGETLHDLLAENMQHGAINPDTLPTGQPLQIVGDRLTAGGIGASTEQLAIGGT